MKFDKIFTKTYKYMGPSVLIAMVATALGFAALFISPVPMIADFGKMLTIGLAVSFLAALIILTTSLFIKDKYFCTNSDANSCTLPIKDSKFEKVLAFLTTKVISVKYLVILIALAVTVFGFSSDSQVGIQTDVENFMPQDTKELLEIRELRDVMGSTDQLTIMIESDNLITEENILWIDEITSEIALSFPNVIEDVRSITSIYKEITEENSLSHNDVSDFISDLPEMQRKLVIDEERQNSIITLNIVRLETEDLKEFIDDIDKYLADKNPPTIDITITGNAVIDAEMMTALTSGRMEMTLLGIGLVFLGLLVIYRSFLKALIPILPISLIVGWSGGAMFLLGMDYTPLTATMGALIIGIGTEFTIIMMERYFEEKEKGLPKQEAMVKTVSKIGKPILASALTTIGGFSALILSDFLILREFGIITILNIFFCLLSSLVVLPALIIILDRKKDIVKDLDYSSQ